MIFRLLKYIGISLLFCLLACGVRNGKDLVAPSEQALHHAAYDDSTLTGTVLPVLMPYNRIIDPAGETVSYGDPDLENHSLDICPIPNTDLLVIEDRYGIALLDGKKNKIVGRWSYSDQPEYAGYMSTYSGIKALNDHGETQIFWSAANGHTKASKVFRAELKKTKIKITGTFDFEPLGASPMALPNEVALTTEGGQRFLYVALNGNNTLEKIDLKTGTPVWSTATGVAPYGIAVDGDHIFVTNWAGPLPKDGSQRETAGVPYGKAYTDPHTGAVSQGTVSVLSAENGKIIEQITVGLHPNAIVKSHDGSHIYVSNGNSDTVSVIDTRTLTVTETISVAINPGKKGFIGDSPNAMTLGHGDSYLYVANGMDNAVAAIKLSDKKNNKAKLVGFIPTEAYPGGLTVLGNDLYVTNLEGEGARVNSLQMSHPNKLTEQVQQGAFNSHHQLATVSKIELPNKTLLAEYTKNVKEQMLHFRLELARLSPRKKQPPRPMPERIGEPSVFKHVLYIIKENRTYDQVLGDLPQGDGSRELCVFGDSITPNQHKLASDFILLDNYYASGKCSAEGHQWTDAAMVTDYVEKNVRAWFRSYPHVQNDALVYDQKGFIWNNAADHGKTVRIYGEACMPNIDPALTWTDIYNDYLEGKGLSFHNTTTISRVEPLLSQSYPGSDQLKITDQVRASAFIKELKEYEDMPGDQFPELAVMALSLDHTLGTRPGAPTPRAMVADNDLALGRILEALSKSRFWKNTVVFVTEDDSQAGWDHVSSYRTTGFVVSPYTRSKKTISTNYNQTSVVRSIEQILGIPPMNLMDATALPMFDCFEESADLQPYQAVENLIPLDEMNPGLDELKGKKLSYAKKSMRPEYDHIDRGDDDVLNRILWHSAKGKATYPAALAGKDVDDDDD